MSYFAPSASLARARARVQHGVADLVRARLPRVDAVAFHLARGEAFGLADLVDEILDRLFARPFELMQPGVDDAAIGAEQLFLQIADAAQRIVVIHAHLIGQLFGIERPAFGVARKTDGLAQQGQVLVGERQAAFELMPRQALVEHDGGQHEFRPFVAVAQIEIDDAGARTVERRRLRIGRGRARLQCGGHAADFELIRRQALEIRRQLLADGVELRVAIGDGLGLARVGVGKEILRGRRTAPRCVGRPCLRSCPCRAANRRCATEISAPCSSPSLCTSSGVMLVVVEACSPAA